MNIYAHRGASRTFPENTLPAFAEAIRLGVAGIELDVHASSDGIPVITHDRSLKRAFAIDRTVDEMSLGELRALAPDLPSFREVLELVDNALHLDIEVKQAGIEREVLVLLGEFPAARWAISCFDWNVLRTVRALDPTCELWLLGMHLTDELIATAHELEATIAALHDPAVNPGVIARANEAGLATMAWTVNDPARARQLAGWGVAAICTDAPELFVD